MSFTEQGMPTHQQLALPSIRAVSELGGSAKAREIVDYVLENYPGADELLEVVYPNRPELSVFVDRIAWGRSTAKLVGALKQPARGMYLSTPLGQELLSLPEDHAYERIRELDREQYRQARERRQAKESLQELGPESSANDDGDAPSSEVLAQTEADDEGGFTGWRQELLSRLHALSPEGFEKFVLYLLRRYGMELQHIGGSADEGIDGIGTAPLSPVLSSRVAVQVKRYDPLGKPIGRDTVALFQRDAQTKGAERAVLVTLSRFTEPARKAATMATPTVDLIDGDRLTELIKRDGESGVSLQPTVDLKWFDQFG